MADKAWSKLLSKNHTRQRTAANEAQEMLKAQEIPKDDIQDFARKCIEATESHSLSGVQGLFKLMLRLEKEKTGNRFELLKSESFEFMKGLHEPLFDANSTEEQQNAMVLVTCFIENHVSISKVSPFREKVDEPLKK